MAEGNGFQDVVGRLDVIELEVSAEQKYMRSQFEHVREELRDIKTVLDLLLKLAKVQEEQEDSNG